MQCLLMGCTATTQSNPRQKTSSFQGSTCQESHTESTGIKSHSCQCWTNTKAQHSLARIDYAVGLIHFEFKIGKTNAGSLVGLSSQNPGAITISNAAFINPHVLDKAFHLDKNVVSYLQLCF